MNPLSRVTDTAVSTITHPRRTAETVVTEAMGLAALGVRTAAGVAGWAARRAGLADDETEPAPWSAPADRPEAPEAPEAGQAREETAAAVDQDLESLVEDEEEAVTTPSGIPAADTGHNPDTAETDLFQPDTEPLMDPATVKAVKSESDTLRRAAKTDKG